MERRRTRKNKRTRKRIRSGRRQGTRIRETKNCVVKKIVEKEGKEWGRQEGEHGKRGGFCKGRQG